MEKRRATIPGDKERENKRHFTFGGKEERTESFDIEDITLVRIKERE